MLCVCGCLPEHTVFVAAKTTSLVPATTQMKTPIAVFALAACAIGSEVGSEFGCDIVEPCDSRLEGCFSRNQALPELVSASMTEPDPNFQEYEPCPLICYNSTGATFQISHRFENPQMVSLGYIYHGTVEADILAAAGTGIILSFYLQSDDKDEIDIAEIFGNNHLLFQTNYFSKGDLSTYGKGIYVSIPSSPLYNYHRYGVRWTPDEIEWTVDGATVRHVKRVSGEGFPESPMRVRFSMWVGGDLANEPGTVTWAGGITDWADSPFLMYIRNVTIENSGGGQDYTYSRDMPVVVHLRPSEDELSNDLLKLNLAGAVTRQVRRAHFIVLVLAHCFLFM